MTLLQIFSASFMVLILCFVCMLVILDLTKEPYSLPLHDQILIGLLVFGAVWGSVGIVITTAVAILELFGIHFPR